ncbi:MAG: hypothetical protein HY046_00440 [Acidobacteria bacterium]|nr:hypothetical protein [Acidobacteriota bacterium]
MISALRREFNSRWTPEKYRQFLQRLDARCGTQIKFRVNETPCFFPRPLMEKMAQCGRELIVQLVENPGYKTASTSSIPPEYDVPHETDRPLFVCVDFGLVRKADGTLDPKLVEIQAFPSLYAFQAALSETYREIYTLDSNLPFLLGDLTPESYNTLVRRAILGEHKTENVVLMEIRPQEQKTLPDFLLTEKLCGIKTVCITEIEKQGRSLFYGNDGRKTPIHRIYNRAIVDELKRTGTALPFSFRDDLDVDWAGHPNWFFRISKFSIPHLRHACVPRTRFLDRIERWPDDLENYVLKPLYSFAGIGVIVGPSRTDLDAIPQDKRSDYILQERMKFEPVIETPHGLTQAEIRVMYIWEAELTPCICIVRMGRGKMMGVDHNRDLEWVGASAAFVV